jgi:hypothetical protein
MACFVNFAKFIHAIAIFLQNIVAKLGKVCYSGRGRQDELLDESLEGAVASRRVPSKIELGRSFGR